MHLKEKQAYIGRGGGLGLYSPFQLYVFLKNVGMKSLFHSNSNQGNSLLKGNVFLSLP